MILKWDKEGVISNIPSEDYVNLWQFGHKLFQTVTEYFHIILMF